MISGSKSVINLMQSDVQKLLTIAIPTFNRAEHLDFCLIHIFEEIKNLTIEQQSWVDIYVSDNASTDSTSEVVDKFKRFNLKNIRFSRNDTNVGADRNIAGCYDFTKSSYVWVFGDDDVIVPGALGKILNVLKAKKFDILYLNNYWFQGDYIQRVHPTQVKSVSEFDDALAFAHRTNVMLTFISGLIVRSQVNIETRKDFLSSHLVQLSWIFPLLRDGKNFAIIEDFMVAARGSNSGGYKLVEVFGKNLKSIAVGFFGANSKLLKTIQNGTIVNFFPDFVLEARRGDDRFSDEGMAAGLSAAFKDNWRYYIFLAPLLHSPVAILNFLAVAIRILRRIFRSKLI